MKIRTVTYRQLVNQGNYENDALEATAELEPWEDPGLTLDHLKQWVRSELGIAPDYLKTEVQRLAARKDILIDRIEKLEDKRDALRRHIRELEESGRNLAELLGLANDTPPETLSEQEPEELGDDDPKYDSIPF